MTHTERKPVMREMLILDVYLLDRHGQTILAWLALSNSGHPDGPHGGAFGPELVEICTTHVPHWDEASDQLTMLSCAADPHFDSVRGYPDMDGKQSAAVLRDAVVGRSILMTSSGVRVAAVESSDRERLDSDALDALRSRQQMIMRQYWFVPR